ncbi:UNVERIFIED_ORG: recombinase family protein [Bacillus sp. AZ43]
MSPVRSAAIYARISSDHDGTGLGVGRQLEDCRKLAADRGWTVAEEYVDNDLSAYSGKARPAYKRMVADLRDGLRDAVVVYNLDRLTRRPMELEQFAETCQAAGVRELATVTVDIDLGNDDGLFMARMFAAWAAKESGRRSARVMRKMQANAAEGRPHGGNRRPFGYENDRITVRQDEAEIIRQLVARYLAGESLRSLCMWLEDNGVRTTTGVQWHSPSLRGVLKSGRIAGLREHHGEIIGPAIWDAIITPAQRDRVLARMADQAVTGRRSPRRYLLSGLLRCGKCGGKLYSSPRGDRRRYVCISGPDHGGGCGRLTVTAEPLEQMLTEAILQRLDSPALADAMSGKDGDSLAAALSDGLAADQSQLDELADMFGKQEISAREWRVAREPIERRKNERQRQLRTMTQTDALAGLPGNGSQLRDQWPTLNLTRQAAIVSAILDHGIVDPGQSGSRALDPARVRAVWRV